MSVEQIGSMKNPAEYKFICFYLCYNIHKIHPILHFTVNTVSTQTTFNLWDLFLGFYLIQLCEYLFAILFTVFILFYFQLRHWV